MATFEELSRRKIELDTQYKVLSQMYAEKCVQVELLKKNHGTSDGAGSCGGGVAASAAPAPVAFANPNPLPSPVASSLPATEAHRVAPVPTPANTAGLSTDSSTAAPNYPSVIKILPAKDGAADWVGGLYCEVCRVTCTGKESMDQHLLGDKHRKNYSRYQMSLASRNNKEEAQS